MSDRDDVRRSVSEDYTRAVESPGTGCCSGAAGGCCTPTQKGATAKLAGYAAEELAALPAEAVVNSFGCGNPLAFSEVKPGDVVLDLGSGAGIDLLIAAKKVEETGRVIGVDMTDAMIERARENVSAAGLTNVEVRKGIIEELPVDSASVDWVISNCVINLSPEKERVFAEIFRVLRPGGTMLVSDIVAEDLPEKIARNRHLYSSCLAGAISQSAYLEGLGKAGLTDVAVTERLVYDASQLEALIGSELPDQTDEGCACGGVATSTILVGHLASLLEGKIASIKVKGKKPAES